MNRMVWDLKVHLICGVAHDCFFTCHLRILEQMQPDNLPEQQQSGNIITRQNSLRQIFIPATKQVLADKWSIGQISAPQLLLQEDSVLSIFKVPSWTWNTKLWKAIIEHCDTLLVKEILHRRNDKSRCFILHFPQGVTFILLRSQNLSIHIFIFGLENSTK